MRFLIVGTGSAATSIVTAIEQEELGTLEAAVDPAPTSRPWVAALCAAERLFPSLSALPTAANLDAAVVAVPTPLHFPVIREVLELASCPKLILSEKPLTVGPDEARTLRRLAHEREVSLRTLYHFSSAPEVAWLHQSFTGLVEQLGPLRAVESYFGDNYCLTDLDEARRRLGTSWLDSGINSLSVVLQFVASPSLISSEGDGSTWARVALRDAAGVRILIRTSWKDADRSKTTRFEFSRGTARLEHSTRSVYVDDVLTFAAGTTTQARYGPLLRRHVQRRWATEDAIFDQLLMDCLHRADHEREQGEGSAVAV